MTEPTPIPHRPMELDGGAFETLAATIDKLLDDASGCPWDRKQTFADLIPQIVEEVGELDEALQAGDADHALDEAGDVLMCMFLVLAKMRDRWDCPPGDAARKAVEKIVRRHTWIFGEDAGKVRTPEDAERLWAVNKRRETPDG